MMTSENDNKHKPAGRKDQGPQGTQVFSREEVDRLISEADGAQEVHSSSAEIRGLSSAVSGQVHALKRDRLLVGRAETCDIRLQDGSVSSEHARLAHDQSGWRVINLLSTNGTFVNDKKISSAPLSDGDHVRFGRVEFVFHGEAGYAGSAVGSSGWKRWLPWVGVTAIVIAAAAIWLL